jgi:Tfp pilus assembly protein PilN
MIQFNLLPDVKQEYLRSRRTKQLVVLIAFAASAVSVTALVLLLVSVKLIQVKSMHDADRDITKYSNQLKALPDIDKILTVQNQLTTLTGLHDDKAVVSRIFGYLQQTTPATVSLNSLTIDYTANTMTVSGAATALDQVNVYVDTLKQTTFTTDQNSDAAKAFSNVVLSSFGRDDKGSTFSLTFAYNPDIFNSANTVTLAVPHIITSPEQQLFQSKAGQ